jgi:hypothetical protein
LCLIDALLELIAVLRGCRPRGCYDLGPPKTLVPPIRRVVRSFLVPA